MNINDFYLITKATENSDVNFTNTSSKDFGFLLSEPVGKLINKNIIYASTENKLKSFLLQYIPQTDINESLLRKGHVLPFLKSKKQLIYYVIVDEICDLVSKDMVDDLIIANFEQYKKHYHDVTLKCFYYLKYDLEREPSYKYYKLNIIDNTAHFSLTDKKGYNQQKKYLKKDIITMIIESFDRTLKYDLLANKVKAKARLLLDYDSSHLSFDELYEVLF